MVPRDLASHCSNASAAPSYIGRVIQVYILWFVFLFARMICTSDMAVFVSSRRRNSLCLHIRAPRIRVPSICAHRGVISDSHPEGNEAVYYLFGRADFTHTRLSLLVLLPLCTLFSIYLAELKTLPIFTRVQRSILRFYVLLLVIFSAGAAYAIYGPFLDWLCPTISQNYFFSAQRTSTKSPSRNLH